MCTLVSLLAVTNNSFIRVDALIIVINVKKQSLYTSVIDSHIENSKNWNCELASAVAEILKGNPQFWGDP